MAQITCPTCGESVAPPPDGICPSCGVPLSAAPTPTPTRSSGSNGGACPVCGAAVRPGATVCDECGVNLAEAQAMMGAAPAAAPTPGLSACPVCGAAVRPGMAVCEECGVNLAEAQAMMGAAPAPAAAPVTSGAATCPHCGAPRRPGATFCRECGEPYPAPKSAEPGGLLQAGEFLSARYRIERKLGGGGMGAVFLARDMNLEGKLVAIKAVLDSEDPELLRAAAREVTTLIGIKHPNIVTITDQIRKGQIPFIVMEYLEGPDWNDLYEQRVEAKGEAFTAEEALGMILGVLPAFEFLHSRTPPVVYRDFKPGQVKVVQEGGAGGLRHVLLDLGVAYRFEGVPVEAWGTAGYAPPEIGGVCLQPPSMDLATICRTLEGLLGIDLQQFEYGSLPPPESVPWIPEELYFLLERGTALDPRRRFHSLTDLRAQLEGVLRLIQGRAGTLPRPASAFPIPVVSRLFTGNLSRTTGHLLSLPVPAQNDPAAPALEQASDLLVQGKPAEALQQADAVLKDNARHTNALLLKTVALAQMGQLDRAQEQLAKVSQLTDIASDWSYAIVAAQIAEDADDVQTAERLYRDLIRLVPGELPPRQKLANLLLRQQRHGEAAQVYAQIVGADPANAEAILNWADALAATNQTEQSIGVLRRVGENAVRFVDAQTRMIELLLQRAKQEPTALNLAAEAIESLQNRTQTPRYYRLVGDWWFEAYQLGQKGKLDQITHWPLVAQPQPLPAIAARARDAYRHYLRVAPTAPDADEIVGRIHFGIRQLM